MAKINEVDFRLFARDQDDQLRRELENKIEKIRSNIFKTFSTFGIIITFVSAFGIWIYISNTVDRTVNKFIEERGFANLDSTARIFVGEIRTSKSEAEKITENLRDMEKVGMEFYSWLPVGSILPSVLAPSQFLTPQNSNYWVLATGEDNVPKDSKYAKITGWTGTARVPEIVKSENVKIYYYLKIN